MEVLFSDPLYSKDVIKSVVCCHLLSIFLSIFTISLKTSKEMNCFKLTLKARESKAISQTARERYRSCKVPKIMNLFLLSPISADDVRDVRDITLTVTMVSLAK